MPRLPIQLAPICQQFLRFGTVGSLGFAVDCASVTLLRPVMGLTLATLCAYFIAASGNWLLNRLWTFREHSTNQFLLMQWLRFLTANSVGLLLNRGAVFTLYALWPITRHHPIIALAVGTGCGMIANFNLSRRLVFNHSSTKILSPTPSQASLNPLKTPSISEPS